MVDYDLVIAGAGPAGLATAIACRLQGLSVLVVEPRRGPLDKACGEGVLPRGARILQRWGVELDQYRTLGGLRFVDQEQCVEADFEAGTGYGVRRLTLSNGLRRRALALGAELLLGSRVRGCKALNSGSEASCVARLGAGSTTRTVQARFVVGADGLHSSMRKLVNPHAATPPAHALRYGMRQHFAVAPWTDRVEVHFFSQGEVYVTPLAPDLIGVAVLAPRALPVASVIERLPALRCKLERGSAVGEPRGAGPLYQAVRRQAHGRVALVGDAAGYVDAATGEGLSLAFANASLFAEAAARGSLRGYSQRYRRLTRNYRVMTWVMLQLSAKPRLRAVAMQLLAQRPGAARGLVSVSEGTRPLGWLVSGLLVELCKTPRLLAENVVQSENQSNQGANSGPGYV